MAPLARRRKNKFPTVYPTIYEGCSNMYASSFITFLTYMLQQNDKRFYKGLYVTFKLAPYLNKKYSILIELAFWMRVTLVY